MTSNRLFQILTITGLLALSNPATLAEKTGTDALEQRIHQFYHQMNGGNFKDAFQFIQPGARGFLPSGRLITIPDESARTRAVESATTKRAAGKAMDFHAKDLSVSPLGEDQALATYYIDGSLTEDGVQTEVLRRVSLVLSRKDGAWKIVHWHSSDLNADEGEVADR